jgi:peptidoglycan/LPS O-acetylase OafA/YrhL
VYLWSKHCGVLLVALTIALSVGCGYYWSVQTHASAHSLDGMNVGIYSRGFYTKPQFRFPAYGIGLLTGMVRHWVMQARPAYRVPQQAANAALITSGVVLFLITFVVGLSAYQNRPCGYAEWTTALCGSGWSVASMAAYNAFTQPLWAACLAVLTLLSVFGPTRGSYVSQFLSHRLWAAPAKLSFSIYLLHVTVINLYVLSQTEKLRYSHFDFAVSFAAILCVSFAGALLLAVFVESPACRLSKHLEIEVLRRWKGGEGGRETGEAR